MDASHPNEPAPPFAERAPPGAPARIATRQLARLALAGVLLAFSVIVLGGYVRLTAAGLGCPDWPGCYGHATPLGIASPGAALDAGKAWREMSHRYAAGTLVLIIVGIAALAVAGRRQRLVPLGFAAALLGTVIFQGVLGMLTVTWQLKPLIVTLHLLFGLTTLGLLAWLWLSLRARLASPPSAPSPQPARRAARRLALVGLIALGVQVGLGGWTSSNYAAAACPDFPTCQNAWLPEMSYRDAFVLWRGLDIDYEGGVLAAPARVAIHFTHRLGALIATLALVVAARAALRTRLRAAQLAALAVLAALVLQIAVGTSMVLRGFPLWLATAHNAGAACLVVAVVALNRALRPRAPRAPLGVSDRVDSATLRLPSEAKCAAPGSQLES